MPLAFPWSRFFVWTLLGVTVGLLGAAICWLLTRATVDRCLLVGASVVFAFFNWFAIRAIFVQLIPASPAAQAALGIALVAALATVVYRASASPVSLVVGLVAVSAALLPALIDRIRFINDGDGTVVEWQAPQLAVSTESALPDVFVLVTDGYARADTLSREMNFDNSEFLAQLEARGFTVDPAAESNYPSTLLSLGSALLLDYPNTAGVIRETERRFLHQLLAGSNPFVASLRQLGYRFIYIDNAWSFTQCGPDVDECISAGWMDEFDAAMVRQSPVIDLFPQTAVSPWVSGTLLQLDRLSEMAASPGDTPRLIYAHLLMPHPPFQASPDCTLDAHSGARSFYLFQLEGASTDEQNARKAAYVDQIRCLNSRMLSVIDHMDPGSQVLITADHGSSFLGYPIPGDDGERDKDVFPVLLAHRYDCPPQSQGLTPMNATRALLRCRFGADLAPLEYRRFATLDFIEGQEVVELFR